MPIRVVLVRGFIPTTVANALTAPSAFGWPDVTNTGTSGLLTPSAGGMDITIPGAIIEDLDVDGVADGYCIFIDADNVTVRNVRARTTPGPGGGCIVIAPGRSGILIEDSEFLYEAAGTYASVISGGEAQWTARRNHIHHVSEGPRIGPGCVVEHNYIHTLLVDDPDAHADAVQSTGAIDYRIHHNTIVAGQEGADFANAALILGSEFAASSNIEVTDNLLNGGGFTLFLGPSESFPMSNVTFTGNRFGRVASFGPASVGAGITGLTWAGNVWDDDNSEVPLPG